jgi:TRAP-type C4-dicarboxylate transport system substrate-binding protein
LSARRTFSSVAAIVLQEWGANPVDLPWGDTIQGLRSGVVDGMETYISPALAYGMAESIAKMAVLQWGAGVGIFWANVEWLKGLTDQQVEWIATASRDMHRQTNRIAEEVYRERVGVQDPTPSGSPLSENDIELEFIDDMSPWVDAVEAKNNPDLYDSIFNTVENLEGVSDGQELFNLLWETARDSGVPDSSEDYEIDSFWDDYLDQI